MWCKQSQTTNISEPVVLFWASVSIRCPLYSKEATVVMNHDTFRPRYIPSKRGHTRSSFTGNKWSCVQFTFKASVATDFFFFDLLWRIHRDCTSTFNLRLDGLILDRCCSSVGNLLKDLCGTYPLRNPESLNWDTGTRTFGFNVARRVQHQINQTRGSTALYRNFQHNQRGKVPLNCSSTTFVNSP